MATLISRPSRAVSTLIEHPRSPLTLSGTALPASWLAAAKAVAALLFMLGYFERIDEPFLPLVRVLDEVPGSLWATSMRVAAIAGLIGLAINVAVRTSAMAVGLAFLMTGVANQTLYANSVVWAAVVLILIGLYQDDRSRTVIRFQFVALYFGSFLAKVIDSDWRDGTFIDNWRFDGARIYEEADSLLGQADGLPIVVGWTVVLVEGSLAVLYANRRTINIAVIITLVFHTIPVLMNNLMFGVFYPALAASLLVLYDLPAPRDIDLRRMWRTPLPYMLLAWAYGAARLAKHLIL